MNAGTDEATLLRGAGAAVIALHVAYALVTLAGFVTLTAGDQPIADPWFAAMEGLIIALAPAVAVFFAALAQDRPGGQVERGWLLAALALAVAALTMSAALHAAILALGRDHALVAGEGAPLAFVWPSAAYAIDIIAWDWLFACALLCAGVGLRGAYAMRRASHAFLAAGIVALLGLAGPVTGSMMLRNVGIVGYAVLFPLAVWLTIRNRR